MNIYTSGTPRAAFAVLAIALTALTLGVFVVMPAALDSGFDPAFTLVSTRTVEAESIEVAISPARIEVIGVRGPNVAWALSDKAKPNCKPEV